jgi:hypothetical protein
VHEADVVQGGCLSGPVSDFPPDRQCLLVVLQCLLPFAQAAVYLADVVQGGCFPGPVPDFPHDRQCLPVVLQCPVRLA